MEAQAVEDTAKAEQQADPGAGRLSKPSPRTTRPCAPPRTSSSFSRNLSELEDEIQASRRIYNSNVQAYNTDIEQFPGSIVANQGSFTETRVLRDRGCRRPRAGLSQLRQIAPF